MSADLVDRFGRHVTYLRVSVTDRCNFRCVYCMPAHGIPHAPRPELLTYHEITDLVTMFARRGVRRVRLTGGEPLVRAELWTLVAMLKQVEGIDEVVMTTNAHLLARYAGRLREAGLDGLNISFDSTRADVFRRLSRVGELDKVTAGIRAAREAGFEQLKLNAVIVAGENDDELCELVRFATDEGATMRFIEFMPIGQETGWGRRACFTAKMMREQLRQRWTVEPLPVRRGVGPARYYQLHGAGLPPAGAKVGIISAVTECFCADCNRVRLTPQGGLRACLADDREVSLRDAMRLAPTREEGLRAAEILLEKALFGKLESHAFDLDGDAVTHKAMTAIGG